MGPGPLGSPLVAGGKPQPTGWKPVPYWGLTGALLGADGCLHLPAGHRAALLPQP